MSYLVGKFNRDYFDSSENENPLNTVGIVEEISKAHLIDAQGDEDYQVINLITREYYDPKKNKWVKIQKF
jgi:hypothetical protein